MSLKSDRETVAYWLHSTDGLSEADFVEAIRELQRKAMERFVAYCGEYEVYPLSGLDVDSELDALLDEAKP